MKPTGRPRTVRTLQTIAKVKKLVFGKRRKSTRSIARKVPEAGSYKTVHRILRDDLGLKAVRIKQRVKLTENHKDH